MSLAPINNKMRATLLFLFTLAVICLQVSAFVQQNGRCGIHRNAFVSSASRPSRLLLDPSDTNNDAKNDGLKQQQEEDQQLEGIQDLNEKKLLQNRLSNRPPMFTGIIVLLGTTILTIYGIYVGIYGVPVNGM
jgi:hypothetical protein